MALKIIWSQTAIEDLKEIIQFIAADNPDAASKLADRIFHHLETACHLPTSNRIVPEKDNELIREVILKPYRIIYLIDNEQTQMCVLRIWHAFRGIPEIE